ncbi:MAG: hypothetical protein IPK24_11185 [Kineosporiaceae bacterium]|nr:hypothetical protein [Kineosporiaceae bacterium]
MTQVHDLRDELARLRAGAGPQAPRLRRKLGTALRAAGLRRPGERQRGHDARQGDCAAHRRPAGYIADFRAEALVSAELLVVDDFITVVATVDELDRLFTWWAAAPSEDDTSQVSVEVLSGGTLSPDERLTRAGVWSGELVLATPLQAGESLDLHIRVCFTGQPERNFHYYPDCRVDRFEAVRVDEACEPLRVVDRSQRDGLGRVRWPGHAAVTRDGSVLWAAAHGRDQDRSRTLGGRRRRPHGHRGHGGAARASAWLVHRHARSIGRCRPRSRHGTSLHRDLLGGVGRVLREGNATG